MRNKENRLSKEFICDTKDTKQSRAGRFMSTEIGYIYCLSNPAMPALVKIGCTNRSAGIRANELSFGYKDEKATGIPLPFEVVKDWQVPAEKTLEIEQQIHRILHEHRVPPHGRNKAKEFFYLSPGQAIHLIEAALQKLDWWEVVQAEKADRAKEIAARNARLKADRAYKSEQEAKERSINQAVLSAQTKWREDAAKEFNQKAVMVGLKWAAIWLFCSLIVFSFGGAKDSIIWFCLFLGGVAYVVTKNSATSNFLSSAMSQGKLEQIERSIRQPQPVEKIDFKCPSCDVELNISKTLANDSNQLRCSQCKNIFHWSDWLKKHASSLARTNQSDVIPVFVPPKTVEEQKTDEAVRKGIVGIFVAMLALPFLIVAVVSHDKPVIVAPVISVIPSNAQQQVAPIQAPISPVVQSQPIEKITEHHTKVTIKPRANELTKEDLQEIAKAKTYEGQVKANQMQVNSDLQAIADRAIRDYPYLDTPEGQRVLDLITAKRDVYIRQGVYPSIALTRAVNDFAPAYAPQAVRRTPQVAVEAPTIAAPTVDSQGCGWVSPTEWKCKQ
jgi:T5orf172 domain